MKIRGLLIILFFVFNLKAFADEKFDLGKKIFLEKGNCGTCHILSDAGSNGNIGPNLNDIRPDILILVSYQKEKLMQYHITCLPVSTSK